MKRQLKTFFAFLLILSMWTTSLHEMMPDHDESTCEICILVQHDSGLMPHDFTALPAVDVNTQIIPYTPLKIHLSSHTSVNQRAPPFYS